MNAPATRPPHAASHSGAATKDTAVSAYYTRPVNAPDGRAGRGGGYPLNTKDFRTTKLMSSDTITFTPNASEVETPH